MKTKSCHDDNIVIIGGCYYDTLSAASIGKVALIATLSFQS